MRIVTNFTDQEADPIANEFMEHGYVIAKTENRDGLEQLRDLVVEAAAEHLDLSLPRDPSQFLNNIHKHVSATTLNGLRLAIINALRSAPWFRPTYFSLARSALHAVVGNELSMQRSVGLNVQLPDDGSSLLPVHADVWDGDSPFEVVVWLPLVDCYLTKSMYILPIDSDDEHRKGVAAQQNSGAETLFQAISGDVHFLQVNFGEVLLFSQTLMHGNRVNSELETRWSMNCRFKSAMSPYADKRLGEFFEPVSLKPATRLGLRYELPDGFNE